MAAPNVQFSQGWRHARYGAAITGVIRWNGATNAGPPAPSVQIDPAWGVVRLDRLRGAIIDNSGSRMPVVLSMASSALNIVVGAGETAVLEIRADAGTLTIVAPLGCLGSDQTRFLIADKTIRPGRYNVGSNSPLIVSPQLGGPPGAIFPQVQSRRTFKLNLPAILIATPALFNGDGLITRCTVDIQNFVATGAGAVTYQIIDAYANPAWDYTFSFGIGTIQFARLLDMKAPDLIYAGSLFLISNPSGAISAGQVVVSGVVQ